MHPAPRHLLPRRIVVTVWLLVLFGCGKPQYVVETERFATEVKRAVNARELQSWATNLLVHSTNQDRQIDSQSFEVKETAVPDYVRRIAEQQPYVTVYGVSDDKISADAHVYVMYGGGFGHWGLLVGFPDFSPRGSRDAYLIKWQPGIYFYRGP